MSGRRHEAPGALGMDARGLLASARGGGGPPAGAKARVRGAIAMALAGGAAASVGTASAAKTLAAGSASAVGGSAMGGSAAAVASAAGVGLSVKVAFVLVAVAALGGALAQLAPSRDTSAASPRHVDREIDPAVTEAPASRGGSASDLAPFDLAPSELAASELAASELAPSDLTVATEPTIEREPAVRRVGPRVNPAETDSDEVAGEVAEAPASTLMEEMALLSPARAALARGDSEAARALVGRYRAHYPGGAFVEEFAAIEVEALCAERAPSAAASRARFERAHPGSTYTARLARACD